LITNCNYLTHLIAIVYKMFHGEHCLSLVAFY
jgi:hypothetical protein